MILKETKSCERPEKMRHKSGTKDIIPCRYQTHLLGTIVTVLHKREREQPWSLEVVKHASGIFCQQDTTLVAGVCARLSWALRMTLLGAAASKPQMLFLAGQYAMMLCDVRLPKDDVQMCPCVPVH